MLASACQLFFGHMKIQRSVFNVDLDLIAIFHQSDWSARCCLRGNVSDARAMGCAGEAAIGYKSNLFVHTASHDQGGGRKHLSHTRSALRTLVADYNDAARCNQPLADCLICFFHRIEYACFPFKMIHARLHAGLLYDCSIRRQTSIKHRDSTLCLLRFFHSLDDVVFYRSGLIQTLAHGLSGAGHDIAMQLTFNIF